MGPAPTREPRMALPPEAIRSIPLDTGIKLGDKPQYDDAGKPHDAEDHGETVEVALRDARSAKVGGDTATEHIGEATAAAPVEKNEKRQEQAGDAQQNLQDDLENEHTKPFNG